MSFLPSQEGGAVSKPMMSQGQGMNKQMMLAQMLRNMGQGNNQSTAGSVLGGIVNGVGTGMMMRK